MKYNPRQIGKKNRRNGLLAEFMARCYYRLHGWRILYKNYVTGRGTTAGEVDFIAYRGHKLAFVEVKKRSSLDLAAYAVTNRQKRRITNAAKYFLQAHPHYISANIQFDVVMIKFPFSIRRETNAWGENLF